MSDLDLAAIRARASAASPGPWKSDVDNEGQWWIEMGDDPEAYRHQLWVGDMETLTGKDARTADFIAAAREDVPKLLERIAKLEEQVKQLRDALQGMTPDDFWDYENYCCWSCGAKDPEETGSVEHLEGCRWRDAFEALEATKPDGE